MFIIRKSVSSGSRRALAMLFAAGVLVFAGRARAIDVPGVNVYAGGGLGEGKVTASDSAVSPDNFNKSDLAFKVFAGVRLASMLGAEIDYLNFGKPSEDLSGAGSVDGKLNGLALFGMYYLPLPLPILDIYAKVGYTHLSGKFSGSLNASRLNEKGSDIGAGLGTQLTFGSLAVRAEYERFRADGPDPAMLTVGLSWSFL
ncbi:MAG TPA: outer membrane beta-barrel protein [Steroidobacteraceae bacterium]|nr:outer membrane beta-barrel protein [Steroidobacteraceae bacterium]